MANHLPKKKKRIMKEFQITEISGVDVPAQEGATTVIMKRYDQNKVAGEVKKNLTPSEVEDMISKGAALTSVEQDHTHLILLEGFDSEFNSGETTWQSGHTHPWIKTDDGTIIIGAAKGFDGEVHTHTIAVITKSGEDNQTETDMSKETEAMLAKMQAQLDTATAVGTMNDVQKAFYASLDATAGAAFLAKSFADRTVELDAITKAAADKEAADAEMAKSADPVVYTTDAGIEIHKSAGPTLLALAKQNDILAKGLATSMAERSDEIIKMQAKTDFQHIPGGEKVVVPLLKAISAMENKEDRDAALQAMKAQNVSLGKGFDTYGHSNEIVTGSPDDQLETLAKAHNVANPEMTHEQAYDAVLDTPEGGSLYNQIN